MIGNIETKKELSNLIRSNRPLIYITTHEEERISDIIQELAADNKDVNWRITFWDIASSAITNEGKVIEGLDQLSVLDHFSNQVVDGNDFHILVLYDFYRMLSPDGAPGQVECSTIRSLKNLTIKCFSERKCIIIIGAKYYLPIEFDKLVSQIDWPLPEKELILDKVNSLMSQAQKKNSVNEKFKTVYTDDELENITKAFQGLTIKEISMICTYFMITDTHLNPQKISDHKRSIIKKTGILEWIDLEFDLSQVGGLLNLKNWLFKRRLAFSSKAANYGLPTNPKGLLIMGVQGAGKSRVSKAIASFWSLPLLRLDVGRIFSGIVGSSEENVRSVIKTAESVAPCILWCDEIDKAFSSSAMSGDSGTSSRVFGTFLTWMQEKKSPVFVVATANDVSKLPPEFIRKGRFDEIFFVDLPDEEERKEIWSIHLEQRKFDLSKFDLPKMVKISEGFTGAEIEAAITSAMYEGFSDNERDINTVDILSELQSSIPISVTMKEDIDNLRVWAKKRARRATGEIERSIKKSKEEEL